MVKVIRESWPAMVNSPVSLADAKAHLRVTASTEDARITSYVLAALEAAENHINRAFAEAEFSILYDGALPTGETPLALPLPDIQSVAQVTYRDADDALQVLASSAYALDAKRQLLRPTGEWPAGSELTVEVVAGWSSSPVTAPPAFCQAVLLLVGDMYRNREAQVPAQTALRENPAVWALLQPYRERMGI